MTLRTGAWSDFVLFISGALIGIATAIAQVNHVFDGRVWVAWCLYGFAALLILVWVILARRDARPVEDSSLTKDRGNATATATGGVGGNATATGGSVTQHFHGTTAAAAAPALEKNDEPRCNITFSDVEVSIEQNPQGRPFKVARAVFENKHLDGLKLRTPMLKGRLIFRHSDGHKVLDLSDAAWLPLERETQFTANSPKRLFLFFTTSPDIPESNLFAQYVVMKRTDSYNPAFPVGQSSPIVGPFESIEVQLLTPHDCPFKKLLRFEDDGSGFPKFIGAEDVPD
jgi:hypothetical protein